METTNNTILITGGTGIGCGLTEAFHKLGNQVIISGRTKKSLDAVTSANPGMHSLTVDLAAAASIHAFAATLAKEYPALNVLIDNAGMMHLEDLLSPTGNSSEAETHGVTNLLGPIHLTAALLPTLQKQPHTTVMMVSSVLGFMPWAAAPAGEAASSAATRAHMVGALAGKASRRPLPTRRAQCSPKRRATFETGNQSPEVNPLPSTQNHGATPTANPL